MVRPCASQQAKDFSLLFAATVTAETGKNEADYRRKTVGRSGEHSIFDALQRCFPSAVRPISRHGVSQVELNKHVERFGGFLRYRYRAHQTSCYRYAQRRWRNPDDPGDMACLRGVWHHVNMRALGFGQECPLEKLVAVLREFSAKDCFDYSSCTLYEAPQPHKRRQASNGKIKKEGGTQQSADASQSDGTSSDDEGPSGSGQKAGSSKCQGGRDNGDGEAQFSGLDGLAGVALAAARGMDPSLFAGQGQPGVTSSIPSFGATSTSLPALPPLQGLPHPNQLTLGLWQLMNKAGAGASMQATPFVSNVPNAVPSSSSIQRPLGFRNDTEASLVRSSGMANPSVLPPPASTATSAGLTLPAPSASGPLSISPATGAPARVNLGTMSNPQGSAVQVVEQRGARPNISSSSGVPVTPLHAGSFDAMQVVGRPVLAEPLRGGAEYPEIQKRPAVELAEGTWPSDQDKRKSSPRPADLAGSDPTPAAKMEDAPMEGGEATDAYVKQLEGVLHKMMARVRELEPLETKVRDQQVVIARQASQIELLQSTLSAAHQELEARPSAAAAIAVPVKSYPEAEGTVHVQQLQMKEEDAVDRAAAGAAAGAAPVPASGAMQGPSQIAMPAAKRVRLQHDSAGSLTYVYEDTAAPVRSAFAQQAGSEAAPTALPRPSDSQA